MGSRTPSAPLLRAPSDPIRRKNIPRTFPFRRTRIWPPVGSRVILCYSMPNFLQYGTVSSPPNFHSRKGLTAARSIQHMPATTLLANPLCVSDLRCSSWMDRILSLLKPL
jgi:hypothetical protein